MPQRNCPRCGSGLHREEVETGNVWSCLSHGIVDWFFENQTHVRTESARHLDW